MNIALAYHAGDREQAVRWMKWVAEIGGLGNHRLYVICAFDCEPIKDILPHVLVPDDEQTPGGEWNNSESARSAAAPNAMFRTFAWHFALQKLGPWAFIEPDAIPLKVGWIDALEQEYRACGKPFLGAHVKIDKIPEHLSGNALMPENVPVLAPSLVMRTNWISGDRAYELAFDIAGAKEVLPQANFSNLIQHKFRHPGFKSREEFEATIDPRAVVFHSCKDGSIFQYLRPSPKIDVSKYIDEYAALHNRSVSTESTTTAPVTLQMNGADTREALVRDTVAILKQLCTAPSYIAQVRKELKTQGVTK